jgi:hypothetical protein
MNQILKNWVPPDRLDRSRPRDVRFTGPGYALLALCCMLFIGGVAGAIVLTNLSQRQFEEQKLTIGDPFPVRFAPSNPDLNVPHGRQRDPMPSWLGTLVGGGSVVAALLLTLSIRKQRRLLTGGRVTKGTITRHTKHSHGTTRIHYEFVLLNGAIAQGQSDAGKKPAPIGTSVCVLYDSENPRQNALYPMSLVRLSHRM